MPSGKSGCQYLSLLWCDKNDTSVDFVSKAHNPSLIGSKRRQTRIEGQSTKHITGTPQNSQGHKKQGKYEKQCQEDLSDIMTKHNVVPWMGF